MSCEFPALPVGAGSPLCSEPLCDGLVLVVVQRTWAALLVSPDVSRGRCHFVVLDVSDGESGFSFVIAIVISQNALNMALLIKKKQRACSRASRRKGFCPTPTTPQF